MSEWVIFDADNTLWDIEHLYDEARSELVGYISERVGQSIDIEEYQRSRDKELQATYGYSACRFARSFEDTAYRFLEGKHLDEEIKHVRRIALEVFERDPRYHPDLDKIFEQLKSKYSLGLITAGEGWVQERRLGRFHLTENIAGIDIVEAKNAEIFRDYIDRHNVEVKGSWVVGDSIRSDINPGLSVGLNAIWYDNHNWDHERQAPIRSHPGRYEEVADLSEILKILLP